MRKKLSQKHPDYWLLEEEKESILIDSRKNILLGKVEKYDGNKSFVFLFKNDVEKNKKLIKNWTLGEVEFFSWKNGVPNFRYKCELNDDVSFLDFLEVFNDYPTSKPQKIFHSYPESIIKRWTTNGFIYAHSTDAIVDEKRVNCKSIFTRSVKRPNLGSNCHEWIIYQTNAFIEDWVSHFEQKFIKETQRMLELEENSKSQANATNESLFDIFFYAYISIFRNKRFTKMIDINTNGASANVFDVPYFGQMISIIKNERSPYTNTLFEDFLYEFKNVHIAVISIKNNLSLTSNPTRIIKFVNNYKCIVTPISPSKIMVISSEQNKKMDYQAANHYIRNIFKDSQYVLSNEQNFKIRKNNHRDNIAWISTARR